jgi:hypothetical protein
MSLGLAVGDVSLSFSFSLSIKVSDGVVLEAAPEEGRRG